MKEKASHDEQLWSASYGNIPKLTRVEFDTSGNVIVNGEELSEEDAAQVKEKLAEERQRNERER